MYNLQKHKKFKNQLSLFHCVCFHNLMQPPQETQLNGSKGWH